MRTRRTWTRQLVIDEIHKRHRSKLRLNGSGVRDDDPSLYYTARALFGKGGWKKALTKAGLDPKLADGGIIRKWTPEFFDATLRALHAQHIPLHEQFLRKNGLRDVFDAGVRIFGSWQAAIESIGLDYDRIRQHRAKGSWSWERVVAEIRSLKEQGEPLNLTYAQYVHGDMYAASYAYGPGWPDAVQTAGFDYVAESKRFPTQWWLRSLEQGDLERLRANVVRFAQERIDHEQQAKKKRRLRKWR